MVSPPAVRVTAALFSAAACLLTSPPPELHITWRCVLSLLIFNLFYPYNKFNIRKLQVYTALLVSFVFNGDGVPTCKYDNVPTDIRTESVLQNNIAFYLTAGWICNLSYFASLVQNLYRANSITYQLIFALTHINSLLQISKSKNMTV